MASGWTERTREALDAAGFRSSAPRSAVVETLGGLGCAVSAREIAERLDSQGRHVGLASVYRTLELLEELRLVQRVDVGDGGARYEPFARDGHHHHLVCDSCGHVAAFEDSELERAIERLTDRVDYAVGAHDVTLRGECPACHAGGPA